MTICGCSIHMYEYTHFYIQIKSAFRAYGHVVFQLQPLRGPHLDGI